MSELGSKLEELEIRYPEEPKCPLVLVLDTSGSMAEKEGKETKIEELNQGIKLFKEAIESDELARKRIEVAVITFGPDVKIVHEFSTIEDFDPPEFKANGRTPMGEAILKAIKLVEERKDFYKRNGIEYYRPWIWLMTDGYPTDMNEGDDKWNQVVRAIHQGEKNRKFLFWAVGVEGANMDILRKLSPPNRVPLKLKAARIREMFKWLSNSMSQVSRSKLGEQIELPPPGWGSVEVS